MSLCVLPGIVRLDARERLDMFFDVLQLSVCCFVVGCVFATTIIACEGALLAVHHGMLNVALPNGQGCQKESSANSHLLTVNSEEKCP